MPHQMSKIAERLGSVHFFAVRQEEEELKLVLVFDRPPVCNFTHVVCIKWVFRNTIIWWHDILIDNRAEFRHHPLLELLDGMLSSDN